MEKIETFFEIIDNLWGPLPIEKFLDDNENFKTRRFRRSYTEEVNTLNFHWSNEMNYLGPPVFLILKAIKDLEKCRCKSVFVVPY